MKKFTQVNGEINRDMIVDELGGGKSGRKREGSWVYMSKKVLRILAKKWPLYISLLRKDIYLFPGLSLVT